MSMPSGVKAMSCGGTGVVLVGPVTVAREFRAEGRAETGRRVGGAANVGDSEDCAGGRVAVHGHGGFRLFLLRAGGPSPRFWTGQYSDLYRLARFPPATN